MKLLKILLILVLLIFPFGELLRLDLGNNIVLKPLDIAVGLTGLVWLFLLLQKKTQNSKLKTQNYNAKVKSFIKPLVLFVFICFFSLLINISWLQPNEFLVSFLYLLRWVVYVSLFFVVSLFDTQFKNLIKKVLLLDGLFMIIAGFLQYFFYNSLRNLYYLGWDEHLYRLFSTFFDPNFAGAFFVLYFLFIGGTLYQRIQQKNYRWFLFLIGILVLTVIALLLTFSRSAFVMFIVGIIAALILLKKKKFIFILVGCITLFFFIISPWFYLENINPFRTASSEARVETAQNALAIITDNPVIGVGFNSYRYAQVRYGFREDQLRIPSHADAGVDTSYLFVLATTGIVGGILYVWIWYTFLQRAYKKKKSMIGVIAFSSGVGLLSNAFFINSLFFPPLMLWMWIVYGMIEE